MYWPAVIITDQNRLVLTTGIPALSPYVSSIHLVKAPLFLKQPARNRATFEDQASFVLFPAHQQR